MKESYIYRWAEDRQKGYMGWMPGLSLFAGPSRPWFMVQLQPVQFAPGRIWSSVAIEDRWCEEERRGSMCIEENKEWVSHPSRKQICSAHKTYLFDVHRERPVARTTCLYLKCLVQLKIDKKFDRSGHWETQRARCVPIGHHKMPIKGGPVLSMPRN